MKLLHLRIACYLYNQFSDYDDLSSRKGAKRKMENRKIDVHIGSVGAAKILFALRPNLFSPWDRSIYNELQLKGNGSGYISYLE